MARRRKAGGANVRALERAATRAASPMTPVQRVKTRASRRARVSGLDALMNLNRAPLGVRPRPERDPVQRSLFRKPQLRAATVAALGQVKKGKPLSVRARKALDLPRALRDALCRDYHRERKARRETMFAKGSAGKARRNTGPRKKDWRSEVCR